MENGGKWALSTIIDKLTNIIGRSMFFLMVSLVGLNVISFWFSGRRYGQLEELVVSCLVWVTFISLGQHYRDKECIRADFLLTAIPPKAQKIVEIITDVASLIIGAVILYFALKLMLRSTNKYTGVLKICYFWIDMGLALGFLSLVCTIVHKYIPNKNNTALPEKEAE